MKTNKIKEIEAVGYFEDLAKGTQEIVKEMLKEAFEDNCETWSNPEPEYIECHSRDGFIPHSFNRGGIEINGFTDLMSIWGSGCYPSHVGAKKEIERQIDYSFEMLSESIFDQFEDLFNKHGLTKEDANYHTISEVAETYPEFKKVLRNIEDGETEVLGGSESSIMYSVRFMYHGKANGVHSASVSAAVNTEGPYHRSSIPWAPGVFCEGAKEIEIEWTNQAELKKELAKILKKVCKEVF